MRLINTSTLEIVEHLQDPEELAKTIGYAVLSHRWGSQELSFQIFDSTPKSPQAGPGMDKILSCCKLAMEKGLSWVWIDTVCIDKTSSAELSEAINSMWRIYHSANLCIVYLQDVMFDREQLFTERTTRDYATDALRLTDLNYARLKRSTWFTRGWTLQELLAPTRPNQIFTDATWQPVGTKTNLATHISEITGIPGAYLMGSPLHHASVAMRMSWLSRRTTTRKEDMAYSMLGIFDVNMPLLYGEGDKAFSRLQLEIMRNTADHSLFAWWADLDASGLLAPAPICYQTSGDIRRLDSREVLNSLPFSMTNQGVELKLPLSSIVAGRETHVDIIKETVPSMHVLLNCTAREGSDHASMVDAKHSAITITLGWLHGKWWRVKCQDRIVTRDLPRLPIRRSGGAPCLSQADHATIVVEGLSTAGRKSYESWFLQN